MQDLKCEFYERNLSQEGEETAQTKENETFRIYNKGFTQDTDERKKKKITNALR